MALVTELKMLLLPAVMGVWWHARGRAVGWSHWAGAQLAAALIAETIAWRMARSGMPNMNVYNLYLPVEFGTLVMMLLHIPSPDRRRARLSVLAAVLFAAVLAWDVARTPLADSTELLGMALISGGTLLAFLALFAALAMVNADLPPQEERASWWMLASVCLYFVSIAPVWGLMGHFLRTDPSRAVTLVHVNDVLFTVRYASAGLALLLLPPRTVRP